MRTGHYCLSKESELVGTFIRFSNDDGGDGHGDSRGGDGDVL